MHLSLETQMMDDVVVIRCKGRISFGPEIDALQAEIDKHTKIKGTDILAVKQVVFQLSETTYIDSSGLGALVRWLGVLRAAGGGLKLCQLSPTVLKTIELTNLGFLFPSYDSEKRAAEAFWEGSHAPGHSFGSSKPRIVCVDTSSDLLAGLNALLSNSGYQVLTTRHVGEAATLVKATKPKVVICGASVMAVPTGPAVIDMFGKMGATLQILHLPSDFHITDAGQAAQDLLAQVRSLVAS